MVIVIYRLDKPTKIFATHEDYQESEIISKYPGSFFAASKVPYSSAYEPEEDLPTVGVTPITLNANLQLTGEQKASLGVSAA